MSEDTHTYGASKNVVFGYSWRYTVLSHTK